MTIKYFIDTLREMFALYCKLRFHRSPGAALLSIGFAILALTGGANIALRLAITSSWWRLDGTIQPPQIPDWLNNSAFGVGLLMVIVGSILLYRTALNGFKRDERKRILAVQLIGLNDVVQPPMVDAIPTECVGQRRPLMIDVRELLKGGFRVAEAVDEVSRISSRLRSEITGMAVEDFTVYAGGLAPVPLLFLFGNMLEDESFIHWMDWQRDEKKWISTKHGIPCTSWASPNVSNVSACEIVLVVPVSYPITDDVLSRGFPDKHVLRWGPQQWLHGKVIDEDSISEICIAFRNLLIMLTEQGIKHIHLVLAAPSALSIRLGNSYDARNMPPLVVYQYESASQNPYPWGVQVQSHQGIKKGVLVENV